MSTLDRYLFGEWIKVFGLAMGATLGVLILEDMYDDLGDLLGYGAGFGDIIRYYLILGPSFLPLVLPVSQMISLLFSLSLLHQGNEITAMRTVGLSLFRISRSLWLGGILLAGILFWLNAQIVPWSVEQARRTRENLAFEHELSRKTEGEVGLIHSLAFYNEKAGRLWFMNRFSEYSYQGFGITVSFLDHDSNEELRLVANEGYFDDVDRHWVLLNGRETRFDPIDGSALRSLPFKSRRFPQLTEDPELMKSLKKRPKDLSLSELARVLRSIPPEGNAVVHAYAVRWHQVLVAPVMCLIVVGLSIPFSVTGVRVNPLVGVAKAAVLFFCYYLTVEIFTLLGARQIFPPVAAAWSPNVLGMLLASVFFWRAR